MPVSVTQPPIALVGTSETVGVSIATGVTTTGSETDVFGNNQTEGWAHVFLAYTFPNSAPTAGGQVQVTLIPSSSTGHAASSGIQVFFGELAIQNTTRLVYCGIFQLARYMTGQIINNATGQTITNASLLIIATKET